MAVGNAASPTKNKKGLTLHLSGARWAMIGFATVVIIGVILFLVISSNNSGQYRGANVNVGQPNVQNAPGKSSPAYAKEVAKYNQENGKQAENSGKSFVAIPVTSETSATLSVPPASVNHQQKEKQQIQKSMQTYNRSLAQPQPVMQQQAPQDPAVEAELKMVAQAFQSPSAAPSLVLVHQMETVRKPLSWGANGSGAGSASAGSSAPAGNQYSIPDTGDIIYAVMDMESDSSVEEAPVMATLLQPPFLKEKILGKIAKPKGVNKLVIQFTTLVLPDGKTVAIDAYAVAPNTSLPEMATSVNEHLLARTGAFLGSVFLAGVEGYGQAISQEGQTTVSGGLLGTSTTYSANLSPAQLNAIAAGAAAKDLDPLNQVFTNTLTEPNTVKVAAGTPFDLFVVKGAK